MRIELLNFYNNCFLVFWFLLCIINAALLSKLAFQIKKEYFKKWVQLGSPSWYPGKMKSELKFFCFIFKGDSEIDKNKNILKRRKISRLILSIAIILFVFYGITGISLTLNGY